MPTFYESSVTSNGQMFNYFYGKGTSINYLTLEGKRIQINKKICKKGCYWRSAFKQKALEMIFIIQCNFLMRKLFWILVDHHKI